MRKTISQPSSQLGPATVDTNFTIALANEIISLLIGLNTNDTDCSSNLDNKPSSSDDSDQSPTKKKKSKKIKRTRKDKAYQRELCDISQITCLISRIELGRIKSLKLNKASARTLAEMTFDEKLKFVKKNKLRTYPKIDFKSLDITDEKAVATCNITLNRTLTSNYRRENFEDEKKEVEGLHVEKMKKLQNDKGISHNSLMRKSQKYAHSTVKKINLGNCKGDLRKSMFHKHMLQKCQTTLSNELDGSAARSLRAPIFSQL